MKQQFIQLERPSVDTRYFRDVTRLRDALRAQGYAATEAAIYDAYATYSEREFCTGWLSLDKPTFAVGELIRLGYLVPATKGLIK